MTTGTIPQIPFGRTGHKSTRTLFGAAALYTAEQPEADAVLDLLLEWGINHIDTAASYGNAEQRIGPWMKHYRDRFFLATKTEQRTVREARQELERSLQRLQVEYVDLWQLHNLTDPEQWKMVFSPGGALEAMIQAKKDGLVRFIGITGHGVTAPAMHLRALEHFDFDSVLFPYNYPMLQNPQYAEDAEKLIETCARRGVAVQTIKSLARRNWGDRQQTRNTWYEPLEKQADIDLAVHWVLGQPGIFLNTTADTHILPRLLDAASRFVYRPSEEQMRVLIAQEEMEPLFE
jgi:aryl-alcohol dehydrogenase-like predicted oxidoreductase